MKCPKCHREVEKGSLYCPHCLAEIPWVREFDSVELSRKIEALGTSGISQIVFLIGGSLGMSENLLKRADCKLSFSKMTFPHQLMRVVLLEQIYRCFRIIKGEPYHK